MRPSLPVAQVAGWLYGDKGRACTGARRSGTQHSHSESGTGTGVRWNPVDERQRWPFWRLHAVHRPRLIARLKIIRASAPPLLGPADETKQNSRLIERDSWRNWKERIDIESSQRVENYDGIIILIYSIRLFLFIYLLFFSFTRNLSIVNKITFRKVKR